jgi:hypothetical protein
MPIRMTACQREGGALIAAMVCRRQEAFAEAYESYQAVVYDFSLGV